MSIRSGSSIRVNESAAARASELSTLAVHAGRLRNADGSRAGSDPLVEAICPSTTFVQAGVGEHEGHCYSRVSNPTVHTLERALGELEVAPPAVCFSTGLAAETALFLTLLRAGDHCVLGKAIYGGTTRLFQQLLGGLGIAFDFVDTTDPERVRRAIRPNTRLIFVETPANPTLELTDLRELGRIARSAGVPLAVDNTFLTPVHQRPLDLGADISVYSTTKHIEGHSSALGGAIVSRDEQLLERLRFIRKSTGAIQSPWQAWLTLRGLRTLALRLREHSRSAQVIAERLALHPAVARVNYPGLASFAQADLAARQHVGGHGGVLSFELRPTSELSALEIGRRVMKNVRLCSLVEHLGSVETLITHPATMTHADVPAEQRQAAGISDGLVRLSVGLEDVEEIAEDLSLAIARALSQEPRIGERGRARGWSDLEEGSEAGLAAFVEGGSPCRPV